MDSCAEAARARDEFGQLQISFSPSGSLYLIPTLHARTRPTGPHPHRARELTTPHPEGLTTRLVPVEVDLKQQLMSALPSTTADIDQGDGHISFVPEAALPRVELWRVHATKAETQEIKNEFAARRMRHRRYRWPRKT